MNYVKRISFWRRTVQVTIFISLLAFPLLARYSHYLNSRQLDKVLDRWQGSFQGIVLSVTDRLIQVGIPSGEGGVEARRPRKKILKRTQNFYGSPWSAKVFGLSLTDLLAGAESLVTSKAFAFVLLIGLVIPFIATLLLGRIYCGWICPAGLLFEMAAKIRNVLKFLEINPTSIKFWKGNKYVVLGVGLVLGLVFSIPLLQYIYPPAALSRESHGFVMALFDLAEDGRLGFALVGLTGVSIFLLVLMAIEIFVSQGFWCRTICAGGALYSLLSRFRILRIRRNKPACIDCKVCDQVCPMGEYPMTDQAGPECSNCGLCIDECPTNALVFKVSTSSQSFDGPKSKVGIKAALLIGGLLFSTPSFAHHIMGIPHYSYDESYPQAPVLKLLENVGPWEFQLTGYPGNPEPESRTQVNVYVADAETKTLYDGILELEIFKVPVIGKKDSIYGPVKSSLSENVFKFYPTYPEIGNYEIKILIYDKEEPSSLRFAMVVGQPGSPWVTVSGAVAFAGCFFIVIRAIRIKRQRRIKKQKNLEAIREMA